MYIYTHTHIDLSLSLYICMHTHIYIYIYIEDACCVSSAHPFEHANPACICDFCI